MRNQRSGVTWSAFPGDPSSWSAEKRFLGARREAKREKNHGCLELTQNLVSWSMVQISKLELGTWLRQIRSRARLLLLKSWRIQASRLNASLNLEQREGLCVGTVQRKAGQVATLLAWRQQVQPCSLVMDGFTLFPPALRGGGGGWCGPWGAQRSLWALLALCLPLSIPAKVLTLFKPSFRLEISLLLRMLLFTLLVFIFLHILSSKYLSFQWKWDN